MGPEETADFVRLLNDALTWTTDESMLAVLPHDGRDFGGAGWSRLKALTYLANNVEALRRNYVALESGVAPDPAELNPILETARLKLGKGRDGRLHVAPALVGDDSNPGTCHVRWLVQRAVYSFARYAEFRAADPAWPSATAFRFRVLPCASDGCGALTACPNGVGTACPSCASGIVS
jgi:hypothetical protein